MNGKRTKVVAIVLLGVLVLGLAAVLMFAAFIVGRATAPSAAPVQPAAAETEVPSDGAVQEYTCSMHPQVRSPNPKDKCPICGMDLIPVPADADDGDADAPVLRLSPRAAALMQVEVWPVERRAVHREVRLFGRLAEDETRLRTIAARYPGRLDRLFVNFTGTSVAQGQPLAEIYSPELVTAQEELFQSLRALERSGDESRHRLVRDTAQATLDAAREKLRLLGLTPTQIDEIETQRTPREHITILAPLSGVVTERHATEGAYVETGEPIYSIADLSHLWVNMEVYETELAWLSLGDAAVFTTQSHPGEEFAGTVVFIDPVVDPMKRTVRVRIDVPNEHGRLKPGMFARGVVKAAVGHQPSAVVNAQAASRKPTADSHLPLVIPATAPLITGRRAVVYVQVPDEERIIFEGRTVTLGPRVGGRYIVLDGLEEGELVVVHGAFKIDSELQIRGRPSMMQPEGGRPPTPGLHDHANPAASLPRAEPMEAPASFRAALTPVYEAYVELQVMLADDDLHKSRRAAKQLHAAVADMPADELQGEARDMWRVLAARLRTDAQHVDHLELDALRTIFETYSKTAIELSQRFGYAGEQDLVVAFCPMAFDDAGAHWLQIGRSIANPYFGEMMFRCGEVVGHVNDLGADDATEDETEAETSIDAPAGFLAALDSVYEAYFEVQNALAADDLGRSRRAAERFHEQVRSIDSDDAPETWSELREQLLTDAEHAAEADIETLREQFEPWAMAMIEVSKRFGHVAESGHFIAHCPMAFDWRGASWLQADSRINNPYFGATMLRCGTIRERLDPRGERTR